MKYKHAESSGYYYKIDELGNKSTSFNEGKPKTSALGMYKEMMIWVEAGNEIEPQYTAGELAEKEIKDLEQALESQKSICIQNLKETDYALLDDHEYLEDVPEIKALRAEWKRIIKSDKLEEIPEKPF